MARYLLSTAPFAALLLLILALGGGRQPLLATLAGNYAYVRGDYVHATINYLHAGAGGERPHLAYNLGNTYLALGEIDAGVERLLNVAHEEDRELLWRTAFNLGHARYRAGHYLQAAYHFRDALLLAPKSLDAKVNLELALSKARAAPPRGERDAAVPDAAAETARILDFVRGLEAVRPPPLPPADDGDGY